MHRPANPPVEGSSAYFLSSREKGLQGLPLRVAKGSAMQPVGAIFKNSPSPYLQNLLEPEIENVMLLETHRGVSHSIEFVAEHDLADDVQVFPRIPGTR
jgi:hypothetical protein